MQNDPDLAPMEHAPIRRDMQSTEELDTTVIEGGPASGLFLPDAPSDSDVENAKGDAQQQLDAGADSDTYANDQLMRDLSSNDGLDSNEEEEQFSDDDDPIVKSHDIFATKRLAEHLYLFQYPIRPPTRPYAGSEKPSEVRIKTRANMLEVDIPIPESNYYDKTRGTQWTDESLRTQTISGRITSGRNYLMGIMHEGKLHVTPLKGLAQLRPNFKYIDAHDTEEREAKRSEANSERVPRAAKAVQVSAKSSDAMPDLSTTSLLRAAEEENWTKLAWRDAEDPESLSVSNWLLTKKLDVICEPLTDKAGYLDLMSTVRKEDVIMVPAAKGKK